MLIILLLARISHLQLVASLLATSYLSVIVNVVSVVHGVVLIAHDRLDVPVHRVVDVRRPNGGAEHHEDVGLRRT